LKVDQVDVFLVWDHHHPEEVHQVKEGSHVHYQVFADVHHGDAGKYAVV